MSNEQILFNFACEQFGEEKAQFYLEHDGEVPFHTYEGWKARKKRVKKGEKGIPISLWRHKTCKQMEDAEQVEETDEMSNEFYLAKAYIFSASQVEDA